MSDTRVIARTQKIARANISARQARNAGLAWAGVGLLVCSLCTPDDSTDETAEHSLFVELVSCVARTTLYSVGTQPCIPPVLGCWRDYRYVLDSALLYCGYAGSPVLDTVVVLLGTRGCCSANLHGLGTLPYAYDPDGAGGRAGYTVLGVDGSGRVTLQRDTLQSAVGPGERWVFDSTYVETLWTDTSIRCVNQCTVRDSVVNYGLLERDQIRYAVFPQ